MGATVFAGMLGVTFFGLLLTPVFFVLIRRSPRVTPPAASRPPGRSGAACHRTRSRGA